MKLVTVRDTIKAVAKRWRHQYPEGHCYGRDKDAIWQKLKNLKNRLQHLMMFTRLLASPDGLA